MKNKLVFLFVATLIYSCRSISQDSLIRLIVRGDDMGFSHAGNLALIQGYENGIERSIEVIVPSPWFPEAAKLLKSHPGVDVGIHLALTSEWENIKWRPLTYSPSLTDSNGYFFPMIFPNKNYPGKSLKENRWKISEIENELRAQIEMGIRNLPSVSHISAHMGCIDLDPRLHELALKLARQYNIDIDADRYGVEQMGYKGPSGSSQEKIDAFIGTVEQLKPGHTYLFVDHPAFNGPEMQAIYHIGYENVAEDRQGVIDMMTSPAVMAVVRKKKIRLIGYNDLRLTGK